MTIYVVDIEAVDTRYTKQWKDYLPTQLSNATNEEVVVISGGETPQATTPGAFLNFGGTNVYKSKQLETIGEMFCNGSIKDGDYFLYTDAWNPTVIQLKYMAELLGVKITIGGLWHAGSYDPQDFLGRLIGNEPWVRYAEKSMFHTYDHNYFATDFHIEMFLRNLFGYDNPWIDDDVAEALAGEDPKIIRTGWPMEYMKATFASYKNIEKENIILFPHRIAPEKQIDMFNELKKALPQYEFIVCQDVTRTKEEYHTLLAKSKVVFSANLQETLGISWYEGALVGSIPMVPDRLSYSEMALHTFKYPSAWTLDADYFKDNKHNLINRLVEYVENYDAYRAVLDEQVTKLSDNFFSGEVLYRTISQR